MRKKLKAITLTCFGVVAACHSPSLLLPALSSEHYARELPAQTAPNVVACSPDKPIVFPKETISLKVWATFPASQALHYAWSVTAGSVEGEGSEVRWNFEGVRPEVYKATVRVSDPRGEAADCSVRVIVRSRPIELRGGSRETGRSFLLPEQIETGGYGLYSYFLLGSPPNDVTRERYLKAIEEYLKFPDITGLEEYIEPRELNINYLPVTASPGEDVLKRLADERYDFVSEWVLRHYDYARARALLRRVPGDHREGPYFVSFLKRFDWKVGLSRPYLYQNQSRVPPHLLSLWVKEFLNQAAQERFWEERTGQQFVLKLRTAIGIMAVGLPEVRSALDDLIAWIK
jgi:hypothetical protein